mgnify:CR=1 FL=1
MVTRAPGAGASVRGTDVERPISGDMGVSGTFEITSPEVVQGLRFIEPGYDLGLHRILRR